MVCLQRKRCKMKSEVKSKDVLFENTNYQVLVNISIDYDGPAEERLIYQVKNRKTGVVEIEDFILPSAIEAARYLDTQLMSYDPHSESDKVIPLVAPETISH